MFFHMVSGLERSSEISTPTFAQLCLKLVRNFSVSGLYHVSVSDNLLPSFTRIPSGACSDHPASFNRATAFAGSYGIASLSGLEYSPPGQYELTMTARFDSGETQTDRFVVDVLPPSRKLTLNRDIAVWDPKGETTRLLKAVGVAFRRVTATSDLSDCDYLVIGKAVSEP